MVVSPDFEDFAEELQAGVEEATAGVEAKVRVTLDTAELDEQADEVRAKIEDLSDVRAEPAVGLDKAELDAKAEDAKAKLDELDAKEAPRPSGELDKAELDDGVDEANGRPGRARRQARRADRRRRLRRSSTPGGRRRPPRFAAMGSETASPKLEPGRRRVQGEAGPGQGSAGVGGLGVRRRLLDARRDDDRRSPRASPRCRRASAGATTGLGLLGGTGFLALDGVVEGARGGAAGVGERRDDERSSSPRSSSATACRSSRRSSRSRRRPSSRRRIRSHRRTRSSRRR